MLKVNRQKENNVLFVNQLVVLTLSMILEDCWFLPKFEKMEIALALQVAVDPAKEDSDEPFGRTVQKRNTDIHEQSNLSKNPSPVVRKSNVIPSQFSSHYISITLVT